METAAVSPITHLLAPTVGKVDPVASVSITVAVARFVMTEVGVASGHPVVVTIRDWHLKEHKGMLLLYIQEEVELYTYANLYTLP